MKRPDEKISHLDHEVRLYLAFLEENLQRVVQAIHPNVKEFDPEQIPPAVLYVEKKVGAAPGSKTSWWKQKLAWLAIAILIGWMLLVEFMGD